MWKKLWKKPVLRRLLFYVLTLLAFALFACFPAWLEAVYSPRLYPVIRAILQAAFNRLPFSIGDLFYLAFVLGFLAAFLVVAVQLFRKSFRSAGRLALRCLNTFLLIVILFYLFWGLNYFREPATTRFGLPEACCSVNDIKQVASRLVDSANRYRSALGKRGLKVPKSAIYREAERSVARLSASDPRFGAGRKPVIKPSLLNAAVNALSTAGYFNPLTSEAQINHTMPMYAKPFTACHELSHQAGFASEDEASFAGFLAAVNSPDTLSRYSAYYSVLGDYLFELRLRDTTAFKEIRGKLLPAVRRDFRRERLYWLGYRGKAGEISGAFYDQYLKFNRQPKGLRTYNEVVKLLTGWYREKRSWLVR